MSTIGNREYFPAREGIVVDRIGRADISGWASATSKPFGSLRKPVRPEVGEVRSSFQPVSSLKACAMLDKCQRNLAKRKPHDPKSVTLPGKGDFNWEDRAEEVNRRTLAIATHFEELYRRAAVKPRKSKAAALPEPSNLLADCPSTPPEVLERLKANSMPRE
jgi:hypothetical protein